MRPGKLADAMGVRLGVWAYHRSPPGREVAVNIASHLACRYPQSLRPLAGHKAAQRRLVSGTVPLQSRWGWGVVPMGDQEDILAKREARRARRLAAEFSLASDQ